jgi:hypothetical protein
MKKTKVPDVLSSTSDDLRPEYAFDYGQARSNRFAQRIDGERTVVVLDADVSRVFTTAESVNTVLRALIEGMPKPRQRPRGPR